MSEIVEFFSNPALIALVAAAIALVIIQVVALVTVHAITRRCAEKKQAVGPIENGMICVRKGFAHFHVDEIGNPLYQERYAWVGGFREGVADVMCLDGRHYQIMGEDFAPRRAIGKRIYA